MDYSEKVKLFSHEYNRLFDRLYKYVRVRVNSVSDAEDIVAEAITAGFAGLNNFDSQKGTLEQWMIGVTKFHLFNYWKHLCSQVDFDTLENKLSDLNYQENLVSKFFWEKIMSSVSPEIQTLLIMKFSEEMTYQEIAEAIGKNSATVRQIFSRLFKKIRLEIGEELYE